MHTCESITTAFAAAPIHVRASWPSTHRPDFDGVHVGASGASPSMPGAQSSLVVLDCLCLCWYWCLCLFIYCLPSSTVHLHQLFSRHQLSSQILLNRCSPHYNSTQHNPPDLISATSRSPWRTATRSRSQPSRLGMYHSWIIG